MQESFVSNLKRYQLASGLTGTEIAKRVGVTQAAFSGWATGKTMPSPKNFKKLSRILGVEPLTLTRAISPEQDENRNGHGQPGDK